jgi:hypothetical protein
MCGEELLGPAVLDESPQALFAHFHQLGGLCPADWLKKWTKDGAYKFPDYDGFQLSTEKHPINGTELLLPGTLVDRFGRPSGGFLAPVYTPVSQRALPPWTLNPPGAYRMYKVLKAFNVSSGTTAAAFEQPGQGTQYHLLEGKKVQDLVKLEFLKCIEGACP